MSEYWNVGILGAPQIDHELFSGDIVTIDSLNKSKWHTIFHASFDISVLNTTWEANMYLK